MPPDSTRASVSQSSIRSSISPAFAEARSIMSRHGPGTSAWKSESAVSRQPFTEATGDLSWWETMATKLSCMRLRSRSPTATAFASRRFSSARCAIRRNSSALNGLGRKS